MEETAMSYGLRWVIVALTVAALAAGGYFWATSPGPDYPVIKTSEEPSLVAERQRGEQLASRRAELLRRDELKQRVIWKLLYGRFTLLEAAGRIRTLDQGLLNPAFYDAQIRNTFGGKTLGESLCRKVLEMVRQTVHGRPRWAGAVKRLEKELADHLARHGRVELPDARSGSG
jgi:hypothetical protein